MKVLEVLPNEMTLLMEKKGSTWSFNKSRIVHRRGNYLDLTKSNSILILNCIPPFLCREIREALTADVFNYQPPNSQLYTDYHWNPSRARSKNPKRYSIFITQLIDSDSSLFLQVLLLKTQDSHMGVVWIQIWGLLSRARIIHLHFTINLLNILMNVISVIR